ncbi:Putative major facilitator superfamily, MFS transporter superfamily [Colletotrichum destructivum]|uniref:Major facilitator superfamily, MFS transporter superfamily n=1 Tax=Colletotrichum destructivum TaxID=34406 RepID=A0AAX4IVF8_9PEZI|nr:Putative major facilitator superfamily, MFS transporter superfamily [Colletotrichum destructivum]
MAQNIEQNDSEESEPRNVVENAGGSEVLRNSRDQPLAMAELGMETSLAQTYTRRLSSSVAPSSPLPDGGWRAWMSVLAGFLSIMNTWGSIISFGVFQTYYVTHLNRPPSDISWIGSIAVFFLFAGGIVTGRLTDAGYFHHVTILGAALVVLGTFMTSISKTYWQVLLAQGLCVGLGNGSLQTPMMVLIATYFGKKLPLAFGIAACGSVTGGLVFPSMARTLLPTVGFGWTMRAIGFIQLGTLAIAVFSARPRLEPKKHGSFLDWTAFRETEFSLFTVGCFMVSVGCNAQCGPSVRITNLRYKSFMGVFFGFFFLSSYARDIQGMPYTESVNLLLILNGVGFVARMLPSLLARYFGTVNTFFALLFGSQMAMFTWIAVYSTSGLYVWTIYYSLVIGGVQSLAPAVVSSFSPDLQKLGSRMGMVFSVIGVGALIGSPIAGVLISALDGSYVGAQAFAGTSLAVGCALVFAAKEVARRKKNASLWTKM